LAGAEAFELEDLERARARFEQLRAEAAPGSWSHPALDTGLSRADASPATPSRPSRATP